MTYGDVEAAFARAAHVFEEELSLHRGGAMTLEGRAVLANDDPGSDMLTVWSATQTPHLCRGTLADLLERDLGTCVYNLGISDASPKQELLQFEYLLSRFDRRLRVRLEGGEFLQQNLVTCRMSCIPSLLGKARRLPS